MLESMHINSLIQEISSARQVKSADIPDIDLYMDQLTTFLDNKMSGYKRNDKDKVLTKAMINNYAKAGLLIPPRNKKYSKENMILLIMIYRFKQLLSINDIERLFAPFFRGIKVDPEFLERIYDIFLAMEQDRYAKLEEAVLQELDSLNSMEKLKQEEEEAEKCLLLVMLLLSRAETEKRLAEKIIDSYF